MRIIKLIRTLGIAMLALVVHGHAGTITTDPPYDKNNNYTITVGPKDDGTADVKFTVQTTSDTTLSVTGSFDGAPDAGSDFDIEGKTATKTVTYPASAAGKSNAVTISIETSDDTGDCTTLNLHPHTLFRNPLASYCFSGNYLTSMTDSFMSLIAKTGGLAFSAATPIRPSIKLKQQYKFKVSIRNPRM